MASQATGTFHYPPVYDHLISSELYLTSIGLMVYPPDCSYPHPGHPDAYRFSWQKGRRLNDFALVWICKGKGKKELTRGDAEDFAEHESIFLTPGAWHRYRPVRQCGWTEHWLCLNGEHLHRLRLSGHLPTRNVSLGTGDSPAWIQSFKHLLSSVDAAPHRNTPAYGAEGLSILLDACAKRVSSSKPPGEDPLLQRALVIIREHCHRPLTVSRLSERLSTSPRTLERHFAQAHVRSVRHEIIHVRLERATKLLANPALSIKEVAYTCGFGSAKLMNYNFQRFRQTTPGQVRQRLLGRA